MAELIISLTQKLLDSIAAGDWATYETLCSPDLTCFEPEAAGHLVSGLPFHEYYFKNCDLAASKSLNTIVSPSVVLLGDSGAVISYVRLTQKGGASPVTAQAQETRVWKKESDGWKLVHFHKSV